MQWRICTKFKPAEVEIPNDIPSSEMYPAGFMVKLLNLKTCNGPREMILAMSQGVGFVSATSWIPVGEHETRFQRWAVFGSKSWGFHPRLGMKRAVGAGEVLNFKVSVIRTDVF